MRDYGLCVLDGEVWWGGGDVVVVGGQLGHP